MGGLYDREADGAESEDTHRRPRLDLSRLAHRSDSGGHAAAQQADRLEVGPLIDLSTRDRTMGRSAKAAEG